MGLYKDFIAQMSNAKNDSVLIVGVGTEGDNKRRRAVELKIDVFTLSKVAVLIPSRRCRTFDRSSMPA